MWFARLFGVRKGHAEDEQPIATPVQREEAPRSAALIKTKRRSHDSHRKGFDPYNSGAFQRKAWDRVNR
jgi:hypothetical protein